MIKTCFLLLLILLIVTGCSVYPLRVSYQEFSDDLLVKTDSWNGEKIGKVRASNGGFLWSDCRTAAHSAMHELIENAKVKGANAIGDLKWDASLNVNPMCQKRWILFLFPPALLTPFFISVGIEATAYKVAK